ncbi:MAG TPA: maleylpyruvate isomerase N-terminal domain-containing protein [Gemmatimonadales bacterium]
MTDFTQFSRMNWLGLADRFYRDLDGTLAGLAPSAWDRPTSYLGWRARDILAHMTSAMPVNFREVLGRALTGNPAAPSEFDTFTRNAREVARRHAAPVAQLIDEFHRELDAIMGIYRRMSDADWERPAWFFVGRVRVRTLFLVQLADNVFHERDLLAVGGTWRGLDAECAAPLVDWFLREFRPATFRPERANGLRATVLYRLTGSAGGEWSLTLADGVCRVDRGAGARPDVTLEADAEQLMAAAQARAAPWVGRLARTVDWIRGPARAEDVVAAITGMASLGAGLALRRIRVRGDRAIARRVNRAFWHFWERTEMTKANIAKG